MQTDDLDDGSKLVEGVTNILFRDLVGNVVHVDGKSLLGPARDRDLDGYNINNVMILVEDSVSEESTDVGFR